MLKKTITFKDLDNNDVTETFYFALSTAEITEMELSYEGGLSEHLMRIVKAEDGAEIIKTFKKIILDSIGERSDDGRRFIKSDEVRNNFMQTDAYSQLFMDLVVDGDKAAEFVNGIMPADLVAAAEAASNEEPAWVKENRDPTPKELQSMTSEQMKEAFARKMAPTLASVPPTTE